MNTITGQRLYGRRADRKFQIPQLSCARERSGQNEDGDHDARR